MAKRQTSTDTQDTIEYSPDSESEFDRLMAKLNPAQQKTAAYLISGLNQTQTAKKASVSISSVKRWMGLPEFQAVIDCGSKLIYKTELLKLNPAFGIALETLIELAQKSESEAIRKQSASEIVDLMIRTQGMADIAARLEKLESTING